jgi:hypothetical protein
MKTASGSLPVDRNDVQYVVPSLARFAEVYEIGWSEMDGHVHWVLETPDEGAADCLNEKVRRIAQKAVSLHQVVR